MPYIGQGLTEGRRRVETFIATANQTTFNIIYDAGYVDVYQNGILLAEADYTATNGSQVVLAVGAALNDEITIIAHQLFSVTDTVSAVQGGTFTGAITASGGVVGNVTGTVSNISNHLLDEDNMASNDATKVPSQQSVKAYVDTEVSGLVDSAPSTLDTLNELAAALGDDANFSTTITNSIATKLPLAGGTLTGNLTMENTDAGSAAGPEFVLFRNSASAADADYLGQIKFDGKNDAGQSIVYAKITGKILDAADGTEDGIIEIAHKKAGSNNISARFRSDSLQLINGTNLTVAGTTDLTGDLTVDTNTLHVDTSNNRVGIGTASPSRKLTVLGVNNTTNFEVTDAAGGNTFNIYNNTTSSAVAIGTSSGLMSFGFNGIDKVHFKSNGNVGIGTSNPSSLLTVDSNAPATTSDSISVRNRGISATGHTVGLRFQYNAAVPSAIRTVNTDINSGAGRLGLFTSTDGTANNLNEWVTILPAGNVGIGTTNPSSAKLDIRTTNVAAGSNFGTRGIKVQLPLVTGYQTQIASIISGFDSAINSTDIGMKYRGGGYDLTFSTNNNTSGVPTQHMVIDKIGNVGIGESNPGSRLDVINGTANTQIASFSGADHGGGLKIKTSATTRNDDTVIFNASDAFGEIAFASDNTEVMRISDSYNVGIGTTDPQDKLHISGASENIRLHNTGTGNYGLEIWRGSNKGASIAWGEGNANLEIKNYRNDSQADGPYANIDFFTGGTNANASGSPAYSPDLRMRIQQTGEVGIGTSNPQQMLHIAGSSPQIMLEDTDASGTPYSKISGVNGHIYLQADEGNELANTAIHFKVDAQEHMTLYDNGMLSLNYGTNGGWEGATSMPSLIINQSDAHRGIALRTVGNSNVGPTFSLERTRASGAETQHADYLGNIRFNGTTGSYIGRVGAGIEAQQRGSVVGGYAPGRLKFMTTATTATHNGQNPSTGSYAARMVINPGGDQLINGQFNHHVISGTSSPNVAFQYDFYRATYAHPMKITCAISHWNGGYMSYTEGFYWGFNTAMSSNVLHSYNGGNGSWTISFPTNDIVRVRMNGDASYGYGSGWYIKLEGNLRREYTTA